MLKRKLVNIIKGARGSGKTFEIREKIRKITGKQIYHLYKITNDEKIFMYYGTYLECYAYMMGAQQYSKEDLEFKIIKSKKDKD